MHKFWCICFKVTNQNTLRHKCYDIKWVLPGRRHFRYNSTNIFHPQTSYFLKWLFTLQVYSIKLGIGHQKLPCIFNAYMYIYVYIYECSSKTPQYFIIHLRTISNEINMLDWKLTSYHHIYVNLTHSIFLWFISILVCVTASYLDQLVEVISHYSVCCLLSLQKGLSCRQQPYLIYEEPETPLLGTQHTIEDKIYIVSYYGELRYFRK